MNKRRRFLHMLRKNFKKKRAKTYPSPEIRAMKGCILKCDLGLLLEHTGIYIGRGRIVGLNRHSEIRIEDPTSFFPPGTNPKSSRIYAACYGNTDEILISAAAARRARKKSIKKRLIMFFQQLPPFTTGCLTGNFENDVVSFHSWKTSFSPIRKNCAPKNRGGSDYIVSFSKNRPPNRPLPLTGGP